MSKGLRSISPARGNSRTVDLATFAVLSHPDLKHGVGVCLY
jgi:hypothetical protein